MGLRLGALAEPGGKNSRSARRREIRFCRLGIFLNPAVHVRFFCWLLVLWGTSRRARTKRRVVRGRTGGSCEFGGWPRVAFFPRFFFDACFAVYNARRFWSFLANMPFLVILASHFRTRMGLQIKKVPLAVLLKLAWRSHTRRWSSQIDHCAEIKFEWRGCF